MMEVRQTTKVTGFNKGKVVDEVGGSASND